MSWTGLFQYVSINFADCIFAGELLEDGKTLDSYGIQDGFTVYVLRKCPEPEPIGKEQKVNYKSFFWHKTILKF